MKLGLLERLVLIPKSSRFSLGSLGYKGNLCPAMLPLVTATRFGRKVENGRTRPPILFCDQENNPEEIEVYVKLRGSPELTSTGLMCKGIAALLGRDLGLPVPEPFAVEITDEFVIAVREAAEASCSAAVSA